jgi:hypothetical protein
VGEPGNEEPGFGAPSRTSIYDYIGVPYHQRWMNGGKFDGAALSKKEWKLNEFYVTLLNFTKNSKALTGEYREIHSYNREYTQWYNDRVFSFVRWKGEERLIILANFDPDNAFGFELQVPREIITIWNMEDGSYTLMDQLTNRSIELTVSEGSAETRIDIEPFQSFILQLQ